MKKRFKSISLIVAMLVLSLVLGSVAPLAAPAEASAVTTLNGRTVETRRVGAQRGRGGVELANAASLRSALLPAVGGVAGNVEVTPGSLLIRHGSRELLILAGTRTAFLTTGVGDRAPSVTSVTLSVLPRTVANRDLFVPFSDVVRHLGGSFTTARAATLPTEAPRTPFNFALAGNRRLTGLPDGIRMVGRGATFVDTLYGRALQPTSWQMQYAAASQTLTAAGAVYAYNRITILNAEIPATGTGAFPISIPRMGDPTRGSGVGVDAVRLREADFGGTDMISRVPAAVLEDFPAIPTAKGGVAVFYNVVGTDGRRIGHLNLTADTIARIYLGQISRWNDPALARLNPGVRLPDAPIQVNWRPDVSGTTEIFTSYLNAASPVWRSVVAEVYRTTPDLREVIRAGTGGWTSDNFHATAATTRAQPNNAGTGGGALRGRVANNANSIGYISFGDLSGQSFVEGGAAPMTSSIARVQNRAGLFVLPLLANVSAAGIGHGDLMAHPVNSANAGAYPIVGLTWIMVEANPAVAKPIGDSVQVDGPDILISAQGALTGTLLTDALRRNAVVVDFIRWAVVEGFGDAEARRLHMAPLTPAMKREAARLLDTIQVQTN